MFLINENTTNHEYILNDVLCSFHNTFINENFDLVKRAVLEDLSIVAESAKDEDSSLQMARDIADKLDELTKDKSNLKSKVTVMKVFVVINLAFTILLIPIVISSGMAAIIVFGILGFCSNMLILYKREKYAKEHQATEAEAKKILATLDKVENIANKISDKEQKEKMLSNIDAMRLKAKDVQDLQGRKNM